MQQESIACPIKGCVIELEEVGDEAFSGGMLGEGFAVKPEEGKLYAPVDGIIAAVFRTKTCPCYGIQRWSRSFDTSWA